MQADQIHGTVVIIAVRIRDKIYTVSQKKTSKIIFVITKSNFHQIWQFCLFFFWDTV